MTKGRQDEHEFMVAGVELAAGKTHDIAVRLTDARGGRVRLNLSPDMAERLRECVTDALGKAQGRSTS